MKNHTTSCIPPHIIVNKRKTANTVNVEVMDTESSTVLIRHLTNTTLMSQGNLQTASQ